MFAKLTSSSLKVGSKNKFQLGCSLGSNVFEGESLRAIIEWINTAGFEEGIVDVADTLHRYNFISDDVNEDEARKKTSIQGLQWVWRNREILKEFAMPIRVTHWDEWLEDSRFEKYKQLFTDAFETQPAFRNAVIRDIRSYFQRRFGENLEQRSQQEVELSQQFYLEELAVLTIQFDDYPCAEVYPGRELECSKAVRAGKVSGIPLGMLNACYARLFIDKGIAPPTTKPSLDATQIPQFG